MKFDHRLRTITLGFKAIAVDVVKCRAEPIMEFLRRNAITWGENDLSLENDDPGAQQILAEATLYPNHRRHSGVWYNTQLWTIAGIDIDTLQLLIQNRKNNAGDFTKIPIDDTNDYELI